MHRVLWVDDDPEVRNLAQRYIEVLGHEGDVVENGATALELMAESRYTVVVTDIGMPGMSGVELADRIHRLGDNTPVIALTGWGDSIIPSGETRAGITHVLAKPIRLNDLRDVLESLD